MARPEEDAGEMMELSGPSLDNENDADADAALENEIAVAVDLEATVVDPAARGGPARKKRPLAETYAAKKTVAQGMMDVALITANANQLKFVLSLGDQGSFSYYVVITLIIISLILQVAVGVSLVFKRKFDLKGESKLENANRINNYVVAGVFLITIINVFIAAFSDTGGASKFAST